MVQFKKANAPNPLWKSIATIKKNLFVFFGQGQFWFHYFMYNFGLPLAIGYGKSTPIGSLIFHGFNRNVSATPKTDGDVVHPHWKRRRSPEGLDRNANDDGRSIRRHVRDQRDLSDYQTE